MINEVISDPPHCLMRRVRPRRLPMDRDFEWFAVPQWPGRRQLEDVVHHAGHNVGGMAVVDRRSGFCHHVHDARVTRLLGGHRLRHYPGPEVPARTTSGCLETFPPSPAGNP
jgi:hypothetical protein